MNISGVHVHSRGWALAQWAATTERICRGSGLPNIPSVLSLALWCNLSEAVSDIESPVLSCLRFPICQLLDNLLPLPCCLHYPCCWTFKERGQPWTSCSPGKCWSIGFHSGWSGCIYVLRSNTACSEDGSWVGIPGHQGWEIIYVLLGHQRCRREWNPFKAIKGWALLGDKEEF